MLQTKMIRGREVLLLQGANAKHLLIHVTGDDELSGLERMIREIRSLSKMPFRIAIVKVNDWNRELSPWPCPPVFGDEAFGDGAPKTLDYILNDLIPSLKEDGMMDEETMTLLGGYSLAGFFALWAAYQTEVFDGIAAVSPSVWFPGWMAFAKEHSVKTRAVYLSLGLKEEKTRHPIMRTVGDCIREQYDLLKTQKSGQMEQSAHADAPEEKNDKQKASDLSRQLQYATLEWNPGNHFLDPDKRTAQGYSWLLQSV